MKTGVKLLSQIVFNLPNYIFWKDSDSVYRGCNLNFARMVGFDTPKAIIGKTDNELPWGKFTGHIYQEEDRQIIHTGMSMVNKEVPMRVSEDSKEMLLSVSKVPLWDSKKRIIGILGIFIDITELKKTKADLELTEARLEGMTMASAAIAHEIRTPLATIKASLFGVHDTIDQLISLYDVARNSHLDVKGITKQDISELSKTLEIIDKKVNEANIIMNMLLTKLQNKDAEFSDVSDCSAHRCITQALEMFILPEDMVNKIHFITQEDFIFRGNSTLIVHVIMNLLKNAIFYIQKANKGDITLWVEQNEFNEIHFKDTGSGISKSVLPNIFNSFFTTEPSTGTGIGLAFSQMVMQSYHGKIDCLSEEGQYTEFILSFPKIG